VWQGRAAGRKEKTEKRWGLLQSQEKDVRNKWFHRKEKNLRGIRTQKNRLAEKLGRDEEKNLVSDIIRENQRRGAGGWKGKTRLRGNKLSLTSIPNDEKGDRPSALEEKVKHKFHSGSNEKKHAPGGGGQSERISGDKLGIFGERLRKKNNNVKSVEGKEYLWKE